MVIATLMATDREEYKDKLMLKPHPKSGAVLGLICSVARGANDDPPSAE